MQMERLSHDGISIYSLFDHKETERVSDNFWGIRTTDFPYGNQIVGRKCQKESLMKINLTNFTLG